MAKTLLGGFGPTTGPGIAEAFHPLGGFVEDVSTEVNYEIRFRSAGTLSNFLLHLENNTLNASRTWRTRKNGANGALSLSVGSSATGKFEDNSGSDSIAVGDDLCMQAVAAGTSGTSDIETLSFHFDATTNTVSKWIASNFTDFSAASTSYYQPITGYISTLRTTTGGEDFTENEIQIAGTWKGLVTVVSSNARTTTTTVRSRKNSANGSQSVSISSSATGVFTDTSNTDSLVAGDDVDYAIVTGTGSGAIRIYTIVSEFETTNSTGCSVTGDSDPLSQTVGTTRYLPPNGYTAFAALESLAQISVQFACTWSKLFVNVAVNTRTATHTLRTRKNGANGNQSISIAAGATGKFEDLSGTDTIAIDNDANYQSVYGSGSGSLGYGLISSYFVVGGVTIVRNVSDTVTLSESTARHTTHKRQPSESVPVSDAVSRKITAKRLPSTDATSLSESINRDIIFKRLPSADTIVLSESVSGSYQTSRSPDAETVSLSESIASFKVFERNPSADTIALSESISRLYSGIRNISDVISLSELVAGAKLFIRAPATDSITLSESVEGAKKFIREVGDFGRSLLQIFGTPTSGLFGVTQYYPMTMKHPQIYTVEADAQLRFKQIGKLVQLMVRVTANTIDASSTFRTRKNALDGAMSISVSTSTTGIFEDTTNSDTIANNDLCTYQRVSAGTTGSISVANMSCIYETAGPSTVQRLMNSSSTGIAFSSDNIIRRSPVADRPAVSTSDVAVATRIGKPAIWRDFAILVSANTRTTTTTAGTRIGTTVGNQTVSIGTAATGSFEDNTNIDNLLTADLLMYHVTTLGGGGTLTVLTMQSSLISGTPRDNITIAALAGNATTSANQIQNYAPGGALVVALQTEVNAQTKARALYIFSDLTINIVTNTITSEDTVVALRINGADTDLKISIPSSSTGIFANTLDSAIIGNRNDLVSIQVRAGASGTSIVYTILSMSTFTIAGDIIEVSESISAGKLFTRSIVDAVSLSESIVRLSTLKRIISEPSVSLSEVLQRTRIFVRVIETDTIILSESISRVISFLRNIQDTILLSELIEKTKIQIRTFVDDAITLSESIERFNVIFRTAQDIITVTEASLTRLLELVRGLQDSVVVSEVLTGFRLVPRAVTEAAIDVSEFVERFTEAIRTTSDNITVSESVSRFTEFRRTIIEPAITLSESVFGQFVSGIKRIFFIKGAYFQSDK